MNEYDLIIKALQMILTEGTKCEDNKLLLGNSIKYAIYNLMYEIDKKFIDELHKDIEYKENE